MESSPSAPAQPPEPRGQTWRILYAEDLRALRDVAQISLTRDGHQIECVVDGRFALERLKANPTAFDLLITDHHMPNMNGLQLVEQVRALKLPCRIIVFSSELKEKVHDAYRALGVDCILPKPIFPSELRQIIARL